MRLLFLSAMLLATSLTPAWAQNSDDSLPPVDVFPEIFPTVTPLPPKQPVSTPTPETSASPGPLPTAVPTAAPTAAPTNLPSPTPQPSANLSGKASLNFSFAKAQEGQPTRLTLSIKGPAAYPVKGKILYTEKDYDLSSLREVSVPFEIKNNQPLNLNLIFRSPGRKQVTLKTESARLATRNALVYANPFPATVFPVKNPGLSFDKNPANWLVLVNLYHSMQSQSAQRQYYQVIYKGQIVQRLLTSSATGDKLTPKGSFKLGVKAPAPRSTLYESVMPFWTTILVPGYSYEYGNHGLTGESYLYYLGTPASHGCLRLSNKDIKQNGEWLNIGGAKWVYNHVPVNTSIQIFEQAVQPFAFENYRMWNSQK